MAMEASAEMTMPRAPDAGILGWIRTRLFSGIGSSIMTVIFMVALFVMLPPLVEWAIIKATWVAPDMKVCREAGGACWAFIVEKHRLMLFGLYPYAEQWRPMIVVGLFIVLIFASCSRRVQQRRIRTERLCDHHRPLELPNSCRVLVGPNITEVHRPRRR